MRRTKGGNFLNQVTLYGGIPLRRCDVYTLACKDQPDWKDARDGMFGPDFYAYHGAAVDDEPWTIEEFESGEVPERFWGGILATSQQ